MAAYYSMPPSMPLWPGNPYSIEGDDPVPPQFATRYTHSATLYQPTAFYMPPPPPYSSIPQPLFFGGPPKADLVNWLPPTTIVQPTYGVPQSWIPQTAATQPPTLLPAANIMTRTSSKEGYKEELGEFPMAQTVTTSGEEARPLVTIPALSSSRGTDNLDEVDHPSYMRPPHRVNSQGKLTIDTPSPVQLKKSMPKEVYDLYDLIPAGPMPPPQPLNLEDSGATFADAAASVLFDLHAGRFGAIGAPSPPRRARQASSSPIEDSSLSTTTRGEFVLFVREILTGTRVAPSVVANAVSYLYDMRLRQELRVRSLQLSFVAALSISHKTLDDSPFTTSTWAKLAKFDVAHLRAAECAVCVGLDFDVRPELNAERFIDATNLLMSRCAPDSRGRRLLNAMVDQFLLSPY